MQHLEKETWAPFGTQKLLRKKNRGKVEEKEIWRKIKNRFKLNKLILYVYSNSFYLFLSIV